MKKLLALFLAICIALLTLTGCGAKPAENTEAPPEGTATVTQEPAEAPDPFGKYETPVTVTSVRDLPNPSIVKYPEGDDVGNNVWTRTILEELGIDVQYLWTVDSSQLVTRMNAMIAGGQLPDFFLATAAQYKELREADLLADITNCYDAYASDYVKETIGYGGEDVMNAVSQDGRMTALPTIASQEFGPMLWIRTDWLDNLGLDEPENLADVLEIARKFALDDPDGNGQKDTWGIPINGDTTGALMWQLGFMNSMGSYPTIWVDDGDGGLEYGSITEETKDALTQLRGLVDEGVIDPEFVTRDYWANYDQITSGKYGIVYGPYYVSISPLQTIATEDPEAEWKAFPLLGEKGMAGMQQSVPLSGYWVISKDCEHPEAVIKLLNFWYREFYQSPNAERYKMLINDGAEYTSIYSSSPIQSYCQFANLEGALLAKEGLDGVVAEADISPLALQMYNDTKAYYEGNRDLWMWAKIYDALINVMQAYRDDGLIVADKNLSPPGEAMAAYNATLYAMEMEYFAKIIAGSAELDSFDEFVSKWKSAGGDQITTEINEWYKSR